MPRAQTPLRIVLTENERTALEQTARVRAPRRRERPFYAIVNIGSPEA